MTKPSFREQMKLLLNEEQLTAVEHMHGPVLVLSGAGSGKTRVVTFRIANLLQKGVEPSSILGLTFTNKAAQEMKERINHLTNNHVLICTFHSLGARILRESIHHLGYERDFTIYDEQDTEKLMKHCLAEASAVTKNLDPKICLQIISKAKNAFLDPQEIDRLEIEEDLEGYREAYISYQANLRKYNSVDFDDLLYLPARLFYQYPDVLNIYRSRWKFLLIDEYQDTNETQYSLVKQLVHPENNLCVVGDPDQSIYSWRGANIQNILNFGKDYPGAKVVRLEQNYRSRSTILEASNALISNNSGRYSKNLWSDRGPGDNIQHYTADTEKGEAAFVAEKVRHHYEKDHISLNHMAVLYRTNAQSRAIEDRLLMHRIPYVIVGGISFYQRREIKDILSLLRLVLSGNDLAAFMRTINVPKRGIGETTIDKIRIGASQENLSLIAYCTDLVCGKPLQHVVRLSAKQKEALKSYVDILHSLKAISKSGSLKDLVTAAIEQSGYLTYLKEDKESYEDRRENLNALVSKAVEWEASSEEPTLEAFLEELSLKSSLDEAESPHDRLRLMTLHNGKGLEFDIVFLVGMEEDLLPHANARDSQTAQEEERRLCYVGMTRAKEHLYVSDVRTRFLWGATRTQRPSRFLREIPMKYIDKVRQTYTAQSTTHKQKVEVYPDDFIDDIDQSVPEEDEVVHPGDTVVHQQFGIGTVRQVYQGSAGLTYKVLFTNDSRERSLVAKFARLKKL